MYDHQQKPVFSGRDTSNDSITPKPVTDNAGSIPVNMPVPRITWRSAVMGAFLSIGGFLFGYDTGQISGFQEMSDYLKRYGEWGPQGYYFSNVRTGLIVAMLSIGTLIGALVGGPIADRIGRRWSITSWCCILIVGVIVQITSPNRHWWQQVVGRWVTGLGVGGCSLVVPMYQGESAPRHIRGALICCYQLFITFGMFLAYVINLGTHHMNNTGQWRITLGLTMLFALLLGCGMMFFPESPRYNYRHGKIDLARRTMAQLYGVPENHFHIVQELEEIREQMEKETEEQKWHEFLTAPRMGYRVILGMVLQAFQQLTGANFFLYYGTSVFEGAGISDPFITQCVLGAVNFGCTFGGLYIVENFGRRKSLIAGGVIMFCMFIIFASIGHFDFQFNNGPSRKPAGKGLIVVTAFFMAAYAMTWGPMIWALTAEIYPMKYRAKGMALATASNWLWNFLIGFFTPFIIKAIDFRYGYVFAGCIALMVVVTYFFVIETRNRTLEEIDFMYINKVPPWKSSSYEIPPEEFGAVLGTQRHGIEKEEGGMQHAEVA